MKNSLIPLLDRLLLRKPSIIELSLPKSGMGLEHSRRHSPINAFVPILSYLAAYSLTQNKDNIGIVHMSTLSSTLSRTEVTTRKPTRAPSDGEFLCQDQGVPGQCHPL